MPTKICKVCGKPFEVTEDEAGWKTMCKMCFVMKKKNENDPKPFAKSSSLPTTRSVNDDVNLMMEIAENMARHLGKEINELNESERAWVTTIYIQRR